MTIGDDRAPDDRALDAAAAEALLPVSSGHISCQWLRGSSDSGAAARLLFMDHDQFWHGTLTENLFLSTENLTKMNSPPWMGVYPGESQILP